MPTCYTISSVLSDQEHFCGMQQLYYFYKPHADEPRNTTTVGLGRSNTYLKIRIFMKLTFQPKLLQTRCRCPLFYCHTTIITDHVYASPPLSNCHTSTTVRTFIHLSSSILLPNQSCHHHRLFPYISSPSVL